MDMTRHTSVREQNSEAVAVEGRLSVPIITLAILQPKKGT